MLQRSKSIFHLGEEDSEEAKKSMVSIRGVAEGAVGLRILIQHNGKGSNIVVKSSLKPCTSIAPPRRPPKNSKELGDFLKVCSLCKKELSLEKDVYMYRGDQGFCSVQCRCRQILLEERREFEEAARERLGTVPNRRRAATKVKSDHRRIPAPTAA